MASILPAVSSAGAMEGRENEDVGVDPAVAGEGREVTVAIGDVNAMREELVREAGTVVAGGVASGVGDRLNVEAAAGDVAVGHDEGLKEIPRHVRSTLYKIG